MLQVRESPCVVLAQYLTPDCCVQMAIQHNLSCCVPLQMWTCTLLHTQMHEGRQGCSCAEW